jgi:chitinase
LLLIGCSQVHILKPSNGAAFTAGQPIEFQGEVTRSTETGGEDRSDKLSWTSSINGHIGDGKSFTTTTLSVGSHGITATYPSLNRSNSISIRVNP